MLAWPLTAFRVTFKSSSTTSILLDPAKKSSPSLALASMFPSGCSAPAYSAPNSLRTSVFLSPSPPTSRPWTSWKPSGSTANSSNPPSNSSSRTRSWLQVLSSPPPTTKPASLHVTQQSFLNLRRGMPVPLPPPVNDIDSLASPAERASLNQTLRYSFVGSPSTVARGLQSFLDTTQADELILTCSHLRPCCPPPLVRAGLSATHDAHPTRLNCYVRNLIYLPAAFFVLVSTATDICSTRPIFVREADRSYAIPGARVGGNSAWGGGIALGFGIGASTVKDFRRSEVFLGYQ